MRRQRTLEDRIAIGRALGDEVGTDVAPGARTIVDDDRLTPGDRQLLADRTRHRVERAPGRKRHDQADRLGRVSLLGARGWRWQRERKRYARQQDAERANEHGEPVIG